MKSSKTKGGVYAKDARSCCPCRHTNGVPKGTPFVACASYAEKGRGATILTRPAGATSAKSERETKTFTGAPRATHGVVSAKHVLMRKPRNGTGPTGCGLRVTMGIKKTSKWMGWQMQRRSDRADHLRRKRCRRLSPPSYEFGSARTSPNSSTAFGRPKPCEDCG
jgi:hypothetical protein